ncbi:MAG TPA: MFS transporter, partial [Thermoanaerobaculia bacterium]
LPYHIGNGWFGGTLPLIGALLVEKTGNPLSGVWFPIAVALMTFFIGSFMLNESHRTEIWNEAEAARPAS